MKKKWRPLKFAVRLLLLGIIMLAAFSSYNFLFSMPADGSSSEPVRVVTVHQGDTLWKIANSYFPGDDPRDVIDRLSMINNLGSSDIFPGQVLYLE